MIDYPADMNIAPVQPTAKHKFELMRSMHELRSSGWVPFTLGPLYEYGKIPFDIIARYCTEASRDVSVSYVLFNDFKLLALSDAYSHMLFVMDDTAYKEFAEWLLTVEVADHNEQRFFVPYRTAAALMDPFMRQLNLSMPAPELIDVWTISSTYGILVPETHVETLPYPIFKVGEMEHLARDEFISRLPRPATAPLLVTFKKLPPDPRILLRAEQRGIK